MAKCYISGAITGTEDYMERFAKAENELAKRGYSVINPAKVNAQLPEDTTYGEYMKMSLTMLDICDCIYMLDGWVNSNGACLEQQFAKTLGKGIIYQKHENYLKEKERKSELNNPIWANAVLKDGKLMFWWTGSECKDVWDFYKDFMYSGLNTKAEIETGRYNLVKKQIEKFEDGKDFYRQYELHELRKLFGGRNPY